MKVTTQNDRLATLRKGVMELYISDHPLDCLTCAANGDCELQDMAGAVGLRDVRYGYEGDNHVFARSTAKRIRCGSPRTSRTPTSTFDPSKCIVCSRCVRACEEVQGTFALTIDGRGFASHVSAGHGRGLPRLRMRLLRRLRAGLPDGDADREVRRRHGQPEHSVVTTCAYCGVGCSFKAEMQGDEVVRMMPYKDGGANEGHSCVKGRFAWGYATHKDRITEADDPREDHRSVARGRPGTRRSSYAAERFKAHAGEVRPRLHRRHHLFAPHQRGSLRRAEAWSAPPSATTTSTPAPASATRRPAMA